MEKKNSNLSNSSSTHCIYCGNIPKIFLKVTNCSHFICFHCIHKILLSYTFIHKKIKPNFVIPCKCNNSYIKIESKELLSFLSNSLNSKGTCKKHGIEYESYCQKCRLWLCGKCKECFHDEFFSQHQLSDSDNCEGSKKCEIHLDKDINVYCKDCRQEICEKCGYIEHRGHWMISFREYLEQLEKFQQRWKCQNFDEMSKKIEEYKKETIESIDNKFTQIIEKIKKTVEYLQVLLYNFEKVKNEKVDEIKIYSEIFKKVYSYYYKQRLNPNKNINIIKYLYKANSEFDKLCFNQKELENNFEKINKYLDKIGSMNFFPIEISFLNYENKNSLKTELMKCESTIRSSHSWVNCLVELQDKRLASGSGDWAGSSDKTIRIWNLKTFTQDFELKGHLDDVLSLVQLKDGRLISGSLDKTIKIWDLNLKKEEKTLLAHEGNVQCLLQMTDGRLASGSGDTTIKIWSLAFDKYHTLKGHTDRVRALIQLQDGRLASGSYDNTLKIWDINTMKSVFTLSDHVDDVYCLIQLRDGRLASGSRDHTIKIWNLNLMVQEFSLSGHSECVLSLIQLRDGRLVSGSSDKTIKVWKLSTKKEEFTLKGHNDIVNSLVELRDGKLASSSLDRTIKIWV